MPLPDADKRSPRVYTLLQNQDLENVTADTLADVGDPIAIEEANEDELRRLCLVAFARMVTKGSFDGWLTAASGGTAFPPLVSPALFGGYTGIQGQTAGGTASTFDFGASTFYDASIYYPFLATFDGTLSTLKINITTAGTSGTNLKVGIYSESNGLPNALLGSATLAADSTGDKTASSFSSTITLEAGTMYFFAAVRDVTSDQVIMKALVTTSFGWIPVATTSQTNFNILVNDEDDLDLPATVTQSTNLSGLLRAVPIVLLAP